MRKEGMSLTAIGKCLGIHSKQVNEICTRIRRRQEKANLANTESCSTTLHQPQKKLAKKELSE